MKYIKHPTLGNKHVSDDEPLAPGWCVFPRTAEQIAAKPDFYALDDSDTVTALDGAIEVKRKPGRPKKAE